MLLGIHWDYLEKVGTSSSWDNQAVSGNRKRRRGLGTPTISAWQLQEELNEWRWERDLFIRQESGLSRQTV